MTGSPKQWFALLFLFAAVAYGSASDIYFAQSAQGSGTGASCANAYAYNDPSNGINTSGMWVAGNTLHICGTITAPAGTNIVSAKSSGSSSNPITVKFEPNAVLQEQYFGTGGSAGIYLSGANYVTVDGGGSGLIQATSNGTAGTNACPAGACTRQVGNSTVIEAMGVSNITIRGLRCDNVYVQTARDSVGNTGISCIHFQGSNVSIHDNTLANAGEGIDNTEYRADSNTQIYNNDFHEDGWGIGCAGGAVNNSNYQIYNNHFHDFDRWTNGGGATHVNGIHCFDLSGGGISSMYLYNNLFDGKMGNCCWTAWVYLEANGPGNNWNGSSGTLYAFNNVFVAGATCCNNGNGLLNYGGPSATGHMVVNNYFYGTQAQAGPCIDFTGSGPGQTIMNNVFQNCGQVAAGSTFQGNPAPGWKTWDYNIYANISSGNSAWSVNSINTNSFSTWQSQCKCDAHSQAQMSSLLADITSEGVPSAGYVGIQQGANLMSIATGNLSALAYDTTAGNTRAAAARPSGSCSTQGASSCWDIAAYQYGAGGNTAPAAPTGLAAVAN